MKPNLTDMLCTECGLCCDGSLFADVELAGTDEASALEAMGLEIEDGERFGELLLQPCGALRGKRCSIYVHRPDCCRGFECLLLQEVRRGRVGVEQARARVAEILRRIKRIEELIGQCGRTPERLSLKERCAEALAGSSEDGVSRELEGQRRELETAMTGLERLVRESFLG